MYELFNSDPPEIVVKFFMTYNTFLAPSAIIISFFFVKR